MDQQLAHDPMRSRARAVRTHGAGRGVLWCDDGDPVHVWGFSQANATDSAIDLIGGEELVDTSSPAVTTPGLTGSTCRAGDGTADYFGGATTGADESIINDDHSVTVAFRLSSTFSAKGWLIGYGANDETEAHNVLIGLFVDTARKINSFYEYGAGTNFTTTYNYVFDYNKWYVVTLARTGGTTESLYVNGCLTQSVTLANWPSSSSGVQVWTALADPVARASEFFKGDIDFVRVDASAESTLPALLARHALGLSVDTAIHLRVKVDDYDGAAQDLSSLVEGDWLIGADISDDVDANTVAASIKIARECYEYSLSKYHDNRLNRHSLTEIGPGSEAAYTTDGSRDLLEVNRQLTIEVARVPLGVTPESTGWWLAFDGYVESVDWSDDVIEVTCRDKGSKLLDATIEESQASVPEDALEDTIDWLLNKAYTESWIDEDVALYTPTSPATTFRSYDQQREPVMQAISNLAEQIGWLCRYRYRYSTSAFELTLYQPPRSKTYGDLSIDAGDVVRWSKLSVDKASIRNVVKVLFPCSTEITPTYDGGGGGKDEANNPVQAWVQVIGTDVDATYSMARYRRQYCEINEGATTNLNLLAQAEALAVAVCSDLMAPTVEAEVELRGLPEIEVHDTLAIAADGRTSTTGYTLAVTTVRHAFADGTCKTVVGLRGKPSGGTRRHLDKEIKTSGSICGIQVPGDVHGSRASRWRLATKKTLAASYPMGARGRLGLVRNPDFEAVSFGPGYPPDAWSISGTWGTDADYDTTNALSGHGAVELLSTADVMSDYFPVETGKVYQIATRAKYSSTARTLTHGLYWYDKDRVYISPGTSTVSSSSWVTDRHVVTAPTSARYARALIRSSASGYLVDRVEVTPVLGAARVTLAADQEDLAADSDTKVGFDTETYDYGALFDTTDDRFDISEEGLYAVESTVLAKPTTGPWVPATPISAYLEVRKNGSAVAWGNYGNGLVTVSSGPLALVAGDYVEIYCHPVGNACDVEADWSFATCRYVEID